MFTPSKVKFSYLLWLIIAFAAIAACKQAAYEVVREEEKAPPKEPQVVKPIDERVNYLPTARLELLVDGVLKNRIKVNQEVTLRPSLDTLDPDDVGVSKCKNPGIIRATYSGDGSLQKTANRGSNCDELAVTHKFTQEGTYELHLSVQSNENEVALASLTVYVSNDTSTNAAGFRIRAYPMVSGKNKEISFTGKCDLKDSTVIWDFADGTSGEGTSIKHAYKTEGQYEVQGICSDPNGQALRSSVSIVILEKDMELPGIPIPGGPGDADIDDDSNTDIPPVVNPPKCCSPCCNYYYRCCRG